MNGPIIPNATIAEFLTYNPLKLYIQILKY